ncbi:UvrD-helicase domain-containing protein [Radiobacillus sp. PE A8.2]|uniref:UvrD-helicase domain-containing protein n=1 Tax=Radiobacillus sp. PE A8.2 TaxID=3380349 RepID=UPI0038901087
MNTIDFSRLSPYELGETNSKEAIPFLITYLRDGQDNDQRLAASAITKLSQKYNNECKPALAFLLQNLSSEKAQVRQYTLKAIDVLSLEKGDVTEQALATIANIEKNDSKQYNRQAAQTIALKWAAIATNTPTVALTTQSEQSSSTYSQFPKGATKKVIEKAELASTKTTVELVKDDETDAFYFRSLEQEGIKLNEPQINATRHKEGPCLVLAGAGSGKTRVLSSRAGYLMSVLNINPHQILLLTFTKKAAEEMKERIALLPGLTNQMARSVTSGTYHSIFLRILKKSGDQRSVLSIERRKHTYLKIIMKEMGISGDYEPESLLEMLSHYKSNMTPAAEMPDKTPVQKEVKEILVKYEQVKKDNRLMDFDDILLDTYFYLKQNPHLLHRIQQQFAFVLCDEWQDTNPIQYELVKMLAMPQNNLFVVGDDDQTIYEFNGADASIILNFHKDYRNTKVFHLDINYRSTTTIVGLANKIISLNKQRYEKVLKANKQSDNSPCFIRPRSSDEEADIIVETVINDVQSGKRRFKDVAILYRTNSYNRAIFDRLVLNDIPFVTYGDANTFYEQSIVRPVIDHLRVAVDGKNEQAVEGMLPTLYVNRERAMAFIQKAELSSPKNKLLEHLVDFPGLKEFQRSQIYQRIKLLQKLRDREPLEAVREIHKVYEKYLDTFKNKNLTLHKEMLKETLAEIESATRRFKTIREFLSFVDEIIEKNNKMDGLRKDVKADVVKVMTIHRAKGLEFPVVYLIGASDKILPHNSVLDEKTDVSGVEGERRLAYVAVTRAEEELYISSPQQYRNEKVDISRFVSEVYRDPNLKKGESQDRSKRITIHSKPSKRESKQDPVPKPKKYESVLVWDCISDKCNAWMRITSHEETLMEEKDCPMCSGKMEKGVKEVVVN